MASFDIFNNNAFSQQTLMGVMEDTEFKPQMLSGMNLFVEKPVRTEIVSIERRGNELKLIQSSPRGAPIDTIKTQKRKLYDFRTLRLAEGDTIYASEIANVRAYGSESELQQVSSVVAERLMTLRCNMDLTAEYHMLGAVQGKMLDADGTVIYDFYNEFNEVAAAAIPFDLLNAAPVAGAFRQKCTQLIRTMVVNSQGAMGVGSSVVAFCGDNFFDALVQLKEHRDRYLNRGDAFEVIGGGAYEQFTINGITWINYRGTDDGSTVAIDTDEVIFFPTGAGDMFQEVLSSGEQLDHIGQLGRADYPLIVRDLQRNMFVDVELYRYPLFICTRPNVLQKGIKGV